MFVDTELVAPDVGPERLADLHQLYLRRLATGSVGAWLQLELTLPQLRVLYVVVNEGPQGSGALARRLSLSPSTLTGLIDRLVERGLIERQEDPRDRRSVRVDASDQGRALVAALVASRREQLLTLLERLAPDERACVARALGLLLRASEPA